jgi:type VI secretion system protein ImpC
MNISKKDLAKTLKKFKGTAWDQISTVQEDVRRRVRLGRAASPTAAWWVTITSTTPRQMSKFFKVCRRSLRPAHAPFLAGAEPTTHGHGLLAGVLQPARPHQDLLQTAEYAAWRSLRESDDAMYLGLAMPRFLARLPYGAKTEPVEEFDFEEDTEGADSTRYTWANSAYAMATNITRAFKILRLVLAHQWRRVRRHAVEGLPCTPSRPTTAAWT